MEETGGASAYGASLAGGGAAGGGFDFYKFIRQPQTIVRLLSWVSFPRFAEGSEAAWLCRRTGAVRVSWVRQGAHRGTSGRTLVGA